MFYVIPFFFSFSISPYLFSLLVHPYPLNAKQNLCHGSQLAKLNHKQGRRKPFDAMFWIPPSIRLIKPYLFVVVNLWDGKAQVHKVKQINSIMSKMHHFATCCGYFVLIWVFLLWFCLKFYFFHRLQIFLFENQPFPLKFVDPLEQSDLCPLQFLPFLQISFSDNFAFFLLIFSITTITKVNPRSYELPANPIKLVLSDLKSSILILILILI